jgi:hypothetical protein
VDAGGIPLLDGEFDITRMIPPNITTFLVRMHAVLAGLALPLELAQFYEELLLVPLPGTGFLAAAQAR